MLQLGKLQIFGREMDRLRMDVCGLSEVRWSRQGHFTTIDGHTMVYSGRDVQGMSGVAIWIHKKIAKVMTGYEPVNDRVLKIRFNAKPRNVTMIQAYSPTTTASEEEVNKFYRDLHETVSKSPRQDILLMMGDFNAKVGNEVNGANGGLGMHEANEAGERLIDFCLHHQLVLTNTCFTQHPRRLYTWISPDAQTKNQIDIIAISQKWKTSIRKCKTYPGADCDTDHVLLVATAQLRFSKQEKFPTVKRLNVEELVDDKALQYELEIKNRFEALKCIEEETTPNAM